MLRKVIYLLIWTVLLAPLWMWLIWYLQPARSLKIVVVDKTVLDSGVREHAAFFWFLKHKKWVKPDGNDYDPQVDYFGFFPQDSFQYEIHDLSAFSDEELKQLASKTDLVYYTDTYGIYTLEWYRQQQTTERSTLIYGGLHSADVQFIRQYLSTGKPFIAEFNFLASPTSSSLRSQVEEMLGFHWTGWTARYFTSLDTLNNPELPRWVVSLYKKQHLGQWPFRRGGMVFVHINETIIILEDERHKPAGLPVIETTALGRKLLHLPEKVHYGYWMDIIQPGASYSVACQYAIPVTFSGDSLLQVYGLPNRFPAVLLPRKDGPRAYYFCGDFVDNPISLNLLAELWGIEKVAPWALVANNPADPQYFFWRFYLPLIEQVTAMGLSEPVLAPATPGRNNSGQN